MKNHVLGDMCYSLISLHGVMSLQDLRLYFKRVKRKTLYHVLAHDLRFKRLLNGYGLITWGVNG